MTAGEHCRAGAQIAQRELLARPPSQGGDDHLGAETLLPGVALDNLAVGEPFAEHVVQLRPQRVLGRDGRGERIHQRAVLVQGFQLVIGEASDQLDRLPARGPVEQAGDQRPQIGLRVRVALEVGLGLPDLPGRQAT